MIPVLINQLPALSKSPTYADSSQQKKFFLVVVGPRKTAVDQDSANLEPVVQHYLP